MTFANRLTTFYGGGCNVSVGQFLQIHREGRERILSSAALAEKSKTDEMLTTLAQSEVKQHKQAAWTYELNVKGCDAPVLARRSIATVTLLMTRAHPGCQNAISEIAVSKESGPKWADQNWKSRGQKLVCLKVRESRLTRDAEHSQYGGIENTTFAWPGRCSVEPDVRIAATAAETQAPISWAAIAGGAVAAAALTLVLVAFGAGLGLSSISPWSDSGVSASTFRIGTGIYLVIVGVMSSAIGGYLAGRLRTKWVGVHSNEVFFRDTAHGFLAWAFATLISATALASATAYLANGVIAGSTGASSQTLSRISPSEIYVDKLLRPASAQPAASESAMSNAAAAGARAEVSRLWTADFRNSADLSPPDRAYVAQVVAARTGLSQTDAEKRVEAVVAEAKMAADTTRRNAAHLSFWLTAALLFGAFAASLAAAEGGALRDGTWNGRVLTPRAI
jgi:hypothetical protein